MSAEQTAAAEALEAIGKALEAHPYKLFHPQDQGKNAKDLMPAFRAAFPIVRDAVEERDALVAEAERETRLYNAERAENDALRARVAALEEAGRETIADVDKVHADAGCTHGPGKQDEHCGQMAEPYMLKLRALLPPSAEGGK